MKVPLRAANETDGTGIKRVELKLLPAPKPLKPTPDEIDINSVSSLPTPWSLFTHNECEGLLQICAILSSYCHKLRIMTLNRENQDEHGGVRFHDFKGNSYSVITVLEVSRAMPWLLPKDAEAISKILWKHRVCNSIALSYVVTGCSVMETFTFCPMTPNFRDFIRDEKLLVQ